MSDDFRWCLLTNLLGMREVAAPVLIRYSIFVSGLEGGGCRGGAGCDWVVQHTDETVGAA